MNTLKGNKIILRALELEDIDFLFETENNELYWGVSNTQKPFSKYVLNNYLKNAHLDIYEAKQLRFVVADKLSKQAVGMIDLFDFEPLHLRAGLGILIKLEDQKKGYASEAISLLCQYAFTHLNLHQLYANITTDNEVSLRLFEKKGFKLIGIKKEWVYNYGIFKDVAFYQLMNPNIENETF